MGAPPDDIYADSGSRLPTPARDSLDAARREIFDHHTAAGSTLAGLRGPGGIQLYSPAAPHLTAANRYLRFGSGIEPALREVAILTTARAQSHQFEWTMHEPIALKEGVAPEVVEIIKHRKPVDGSVPEEFALVIRLGRAIFGDRKVPSDLFAAARARFGDHKLVDLVLLMGNYAATAALLTAFDMQLPADRPPLLPEGS